jgi:hypothetical protein
MTGAHSGGTAADWEEDEGPVDSCVAASMGSHAPNQAQKESQIAETVADDARPCVSCALCNKG